MRTACRRPGWLARLLAGHEAGAAVVGGSLDLPRGLSPMARCDYYCGWYHVHSRRPAGEVPNHPPGNLSVRRADFARTPGFTEQQPVAYAHEELAWQAECFAAAADRVRSRGDRLPLQPPGLPQPAPPQLPLGIQRHREQGADRRGSLRVGLPLSRACWWPRASRWRSGAPPTSVACWVRAGMLEPLLMLPAVLAARLAYSAGLVAGGIRWMRFGTAAAEARPRWE